MATQRDIFTSILACRKNKKDSISDITDYISVKFNVCITEEVRNEIKNQNRLLQFRYTNVHKRKKSYEEVASVADNSEHLLDSQDMENKLEKSIIHEDNAVLDAAQQSDDQETPSKMIRKSFQVCDERHKKRRSQHLIDAIEGFIETDCDGELSVNQVVGYLLIRENRQSNKDIAAVGQNLYDENAAHINACFSIEDAIALMHWMPLTREQMRQIRWFLRARGVDLFPTTNDLIDARKKLRPLVEPVLNGKGVACDYVELVRGTTEALVELYAPQDYTDNDLRVVFKDGADGAGSQAIWKSTKMSNAAPNMYQYGIVPLRLETTVNPSTVLWKNPSPNSPLSLRPVYLVREVESDADLTAEVITKTDRCRNTLMEHGIRVLYNDTTLNVKVQIFDTMKDLKYKKMLSGLGGADCILCDTQVADWTNVEKVTNGFTINRSAEETEALYHALADEDGTIPRKPKDFDTRKGLTKKPATTSDQRNITITHSYINGTSWFVKFLVRIAIDYLRWEERADYRGEPLRVSKARVLAAIEDKTGLRLEQVSSAGHGGTSTDGNTGRRFFSNELKEVLVELIPEKHQVNALLLHLQLSSILRIISCTSKVDVDKFDELCKKTGINLGINFPWARLNFTLHSSIQHSAELIRQNAEMGLGDLSEEALGANNKDIRKFLGDFSRKADPVLQLTDVMYRTLERSHPKIRCQIAQFRPSKCCSACGARNHTIRTHHKVMGGGVIGQYDSYVCDIIC